ncbi:WD40 repeat domain-containing protein [Planctomycetota bacterium]
MPLQDLNVVYSGTGKQDPVIQMWDGLSDGVKPVTLSRFPRGYSIYEQAISPRGTRLAAGTRTGFLRVHSLTDYRGIENCPAHFEVYDRPSVDCLAFSTENILASGGKKGIIKLWSLVEKEQVGQMTAHEGGVLALCAIGSLLLASLGADGRMRIWDLDTLRCVHETEVLPLPKLAAVTRLDYNPTTGLLMHPSRTGHVYIYDVEHNFTKITVKAHEGDFVAVCSGQKGVITGGLDDRKLCLWSTDMQQMISSCMASAGILVAVWAGTEHIVTGLRNGSLMTWLVQEDQLSVVQTYSLDVRSCIGLPAKAIAEKAVLEENQWRDAKVAEARRLIPPSDPASIQQFTSIIEGLNSRGLSLEASLLLAEAANQMERPLWELELRFKQIEALGDSEMSLPCRYALAGLLETVNEHRMAISHFERIVEIQSDYKDTKVRIDSLKKHPLVKGYDNNLVRADIAPIEILPQEIEKYRILNKKFNQRVVYSEGKTVPVAPNATVKEVFDCVRNALMNSGNSYARISLQQVTLLQRNRLRKAQWIYITHQNTDLSLAFGLEVSASTATMQFTGYAVFTPDRIGTSETGSISDYNQLVAEAWDRLRENYQVTDQWLKLTSDYALKAVRKLANARQEHRSAF